MLPRTRICLIAVVACVILALTFPVRTDHIRIDPVTGSVKFQTSWLFVPTKTRIEQSELERWIIAHEGFHESQWGFVNDTSRMISGRVAGRACRSWPIDLFQAGDLNTSFVRNATDAEITEFVRVMRHGTRDEQRNAVDAAAKTLERGYGSHSSARPSAVGPQSPATASGNDGAAARSGSVGAVR